MTKSYQTKEMIVQPKNVCRIDGCQSKRDARGLCKKHYGRWYRLGDPLHKCKGDKNDYTIENDIVYMNAYNTKQEKTCTFLIDKLDLERVSIYCWYLKDPGYITASIGLRDIYLHRFLTFAQPGDVVDHINRDKLDYRQENLRRVDYFINAHNTPVSKTNQLQTKGVTKRFLKWRITL